MAQVPTELLLIRHGQSEANVGLSTDPDCGLSPAGHEQAVALAGRLVGYDLRGFTGVCSPYRRAVQTARIIADATGLEFIRDERVREWGPAATAGGRSFPQEPVESAAQRLREFLRRSRGKRLVVVSHAAPIALLTQLAWGEVPVARGEFWAGVGNCCPRWVKTTCDVEGPL
jgi:broad specificity phosphatase PhoE